MEAKMFRLMLTSTLITTQRVNRLVSWQNFVSTPVSRLLCEEEGTRKISEQSEPSVDWGGERGGTRSLSTSTINMAAYRFGSLVLGQEQEYPTTFFSQIH